MAITYELSKTIRGGKQYFLEVLFPTSSTGKFLNISIISLNSIIKDTGMYEDRSPRLYTFSLSDYIIVRDPNFTGTQLPLFIESQELSRQRSRYLSMLGGAGNNFGTALAGSPSCVLEDYLPTTVKFAVGFLNQTDLSDRTIYDPNADYTAAGGNPIGTEDFNDQKIKYILCRYSVNVTFL